MRIKRILARLRKERRAIDEAIAALEQIGARAKSLKGNSSARSRCEAPAPEAGNTASPSQSGSPIPETKVIDFPRNQRAAG
jgi:hypothetical protein